MNDQLPYRTVPDPSAVAGGALAFPRPVLSRLLPGLTAILLLLIGCGYWGFLRIQEKQRRDLCRLVKQQACGDLEQLLGEQARGLEAVQVPLLSHVELIAAFKAGDRGRLLAIARPLFNELNARVAITHFNFIKPDRTVWLRLHKPELFGDRIDRFTALEAERTKAVAVGLEFGQIGTFTLRVVRPVFDGGQLLGYLELGKEIEDVLDRIVEFDGVEKILAIRKDALDRSRFEVGMAMLGREADWDRLPDHAVIYSSIPLPVEAECLVGGDAVNQKHAAADEIRVDTRHWRISSVPMTDASGRDVGELLLLHDVTTLKAAQRKETFVAGAVAVTLLGALLAMVFVMLRRSDTGIRNQQRELAERAARLKTQDQQLEQADRLASSGAAFRRVRAGGDVS